MEAHSHHDTTRSMDHMVARFNNMFKSERLIYKAFEDTPQVHDFMMDLYSDPSVKGLSEFGALKPVSKKDIDKLINFLIEKTLLAVLICLPSTSPESKQTVIGYIAVKDKWNKVGELGLCLSQSYQNKGYGREAINWAIDWAFLWGGVHRLGIEAMAFNERALKLYKGIGFIEEGRMRGAAWADGAWYDVIAFGMLEYEWKQMRRI